MPAASDDHDVLVFTSGDEQAKMMLKGLEVMGLAGRWQKAGNFKGSFQNSVPVRDEVSVRLRLNGERDIGAARKGLQAVGVEIGI